MQQAVDATQIHECAVVGKVLDDTLDLLTLFQSLQQLLALCAVLLLHHGAAGNHYVVAALIQLDHLEFEILAFEICGVAYRTHVHQRTGQECTDIAELDGKSTLDLAVDTTVNGLLCFKCRFQHFPGLVALGLFAGEPGRAEAIFHGIQGDFYLITDVDFDLAIQIKELGTRDHAFGLESGIDDDGFGGDVQHRADNDGTGTKLGIGEALLK